MAGAAPSTDAGLTHPAPPAVDTPARAFKFAIDRGGTFCDVFAEVRVGERKRVSSTRGFSQPPPGSARFAPCPTLNLLSLPLFLQCPDGRGGTKYRCERGRRRESARACELLTDPVSAFSLTPSLSIPPPPPPLFFLPSLALPKTRITKLLSVDPANYPDAPREGIRRILEEETGIPHPRDAPLDTSRIAGVRMGTTVATNALLERAGERCVLAITAGFRDLLHIGNQARPAIFDLAVRCPGVLHEAVVEVEESVVLPLGGEPGGRAGVDPAADAAAYTPAGEDAAAVTGEAVRVEKAPDLEVVKKDLAALHAAGFRSLAVVFKHAALFPAHERAVAAVARAVGFTQVSLSSDVSPVVKMVPRGFTATADAYLTPHIARYIAAFQSGFDGGLMAESAGGGEGGGGAGAAASSRLAFMQSDGALAPVASFSGHRAILSGPAGGYVGYARTTRWGDGSEGGGDGGGGGVFTPPQVIGFDMVRGRGGKKEERERFWGGGIAPATPSAHFPPHSHISSLSLSLSPAPSHRAAPPPTCPGTRARTSTSTNRRPRA